METNNLKNIFYISIVFFYSVLINQYYGNLGLHSLDSTIGLSNGYRLTTGQTPFVDYWVSSGFLTDVIQSYFFKIFGFSWQIYVLHASIFNALLAISVYIFLYFLNFLKIHAFLYSLATATIAYPVAGVVLVDFHSLILSIIGIIIFYYSIKKKNKIILITVPLVYMLAFLCKQIPAGYFALLISFFILLYCYKNKIIWPIVYLLIGSFVSLSLLIVFLNLKEIELNTFFTQYVNFSSTIFSNSQKSSIILQLKELLKIKYFLLIFILFILKISIKQFKTKDNNSSMIVSIIIISSAAVFLTEIFTNNQNVTLGIMPLLIALISALFIKRPMTNDSLKYFIYFIILILFIRTVMINSIYLAFIPVLALIYFYKKSLLKNFTSQFLILVLFFTSFYFEKFVKIRRFNDIFHNVSTFVPGKNISPKFSGLRWKTNFVNTNEEIEMITFVLNHKNIKDDNLLVITNLQIYDFLIDRKNNSPVKYWLKDKSYPSNKNSLRINFENFFQEKVKEKNITKILIINDNDFKLEEFDFLSNCFGLSNVLKYQIKEYEKKDACI